jgi:hypothetical protein
LQEWYEQQEDAVCAEFDTSLEYLRDLPPERWDWPFVGILRRECLGLIEIRFKASKVQYRPLGCYGPLRYEFTILFFAVEKGRKLKPPTACATALVRKVQVLQNRGSSREFTLR